LNDLAINEVSEMPRSKKYLPVAIVIIITSIISCSDISYGTQKEKIEAHNIDQSHPGLSIYDLWKIFHLSQ
jgi:hypothetical protein